MPGSSRAINFGNLSVFERTFGGKNVLVTGHTGFTGGWLCLWLSAIGANVTGLSLAPNTEPNLFDALGVETFTSSRIGDITDLGAVQAAYAAGSPEIVFHLAAQPLVSRGYEDPLESFHTNILGTANVLEAARQSDGVKAVVCVTSDKVYEDQNSQQGYSETDRLGGKDPYSASKSAAEMIAKTYQRTLAERGNGVAIATARGGNIIGGGDWSDNRIVPDFVRAHTAKSPLTLRHPEAIRPWQHVIALCHGYLVLAHALLDDCPDIAEAYNFGPLDADIKTVGELVTALSTHWPGIALEFETGTFAETATLCVNSAKARSELSWVPPIGLDDAVGWTARWYQAFYDAPDKCLETSAAQLAAYRERLAA